MIKVRIYHLHAARLAKLRRELEYTSGRDFFRTIPLRTELEFLRSYMQEASPLMQKPISQTKQWMNEMGSRKLLPRFATSWRIKAETRGNDRVWLIWNILENIPQSGAKAKFRAIEFGSSTQFWSPKRNYRFADARGRWYRLSVGQNILHKSNKPANVLKKTSRYIDRVLRPMVDLKIREIIKRRLQTV